MKKLNSKSMKSGMIALLLSSQALMTPFVAYAEETTAAEIQSEMAQENEAEETETMEESAEMVESGEMEESAEASTTPKLSEEELRSQIKDYGTKITVKGKQMNVLELGKEHKDQNKTLVFMPGLGEASQPLTQKNLLDRLAENFHILVVEPFGYGLSDSTDEPRTSENIINELHEALQQFDVSEYVLVAHSLSGIYAMEYAKQFPEEVKGIVGMDTSTPMMNGYMDMGHMEAPVDEEGNALYLPEIPDVDDEVNEQYKLIAQLNLNNPATTDEAERSNQVLLDAKDEKIPAGIPALYLLAQDSYDDIEMRREFMDQITMDWEEQHVDMSENPDEVETHVLDGDHLLYFTQYEEMAKLITEFVMNLK